MVTEQKGAIIAGAGQGIGAILYLERAGFVTAETIHVDGSQTADH